LAPSSATAFQLIQTSYSIGRGKLQAEQIEIKLKKCIFIELAAEIIWWYGIKAFLKREIGSHLW